jgi:prepilin-type processing-associated H-X9-DG protein
MALLPTGSATADVRCAGYANRARVATHGLHRHLFTTTLNTRWCYDGRRVVRLSDVRVEPALSTLGSLLTWEFRGLVRAASENRAFSLDGRPRAGYRVRRVAHWRQCLARCFNYYVELNNFLYADGHARRLNRVGR